MRKKGIKHRVVIHNEIQAAADLLKKKQLVAFPTETVYGLGAIIWEEEAVGQIFSVKGRPPDNPLIAHIGNLDEVHLLAKNIPPVFWKLVDRFFPGPLSIVLPKKKSVPYIATGGLDSVAIRMPSNLIAQQLIRACGAPLVAPSANLSGKPSPVTAEQVADDFGEKIAYILDGGKVDYGIESTVISLCSTQGPSLLRPGNITKEEIEAVMGTSLGSPQKEAPPASPGMKYRHYAPCGKVFFFETTEELKQHLLKNPKINRLILGDPLPLNAKTLYLSLRQADKQMCEEICVYINQATRCDQALMNRLSRIILD